MSSDALRWALSRKLTGPLPAETRLVLVALAEHANPDGEGAWPGVARLADTIGVSERTVRRQLAHLEGLGLIRRGDQRHVDHYPANRRPVVYDLDITGTGILIAQPVNPDGTLADVTMPPDSPVTGDTPTPARDDTPVTPETPARGDTADTPTESWGVTGRRSGVSPVTPKPRTKELHTPLPPKSPPPPAEQQRAHALAAAGYTPDGIHRQCGTNHPLGLSCPPLTPMPAGWRDRALTPTALDTVDWARCPSCDGPSLTPGLCRGCTDAGVTPQPPPALFDETGLAG